MNEKNPLTLAEQAANDQSRAALAQMGIRLDSEVRIGMLFAVSSEGVSACIAQPFMPADIVVAVLRRAADMIEATV